VDGFISLHVIKNFSVFAGEYEAAVGLSGCCGSIQVVHVKWGNYPAGRFKKMFKRKRKSPIISLLIAR
jgi:hypothetical protein